MSDENNARPPSAADAERIAQLEERLARIEAHLGLAREASPAPVVAATAPLVAAPSEPEPRSEDELEYQVGQSWFAVAGIAALTIGGGFLISLPFARLPAAAPALAGYAVVVVLLGVAHIWRESFALVASHLRGAGMALLFISTLRLFFPEAHHALDLGSLAGKLLLLSVVALNFVLALRRKSPWLTGLALVTGCAAVVVAGTAGFSLPLLVLLLAVTLVASQRFDWPVLEVAAVPIGFTTYLLWALGNPLRGGPVHLTTEPLIAPVVVLVCVMILATGPWLRPREEREGPQPSISALLNCGLGFGVFLIHSTVAFRDSVAPLHVAAFVVFLGLAVAFWVRQQSRVATFFYAMTGYAALSAAIFKASSVPAVFVWLSMQSVVVVATAIWFRSRFIVVANFLIYVCIVLGYVIVAERETGISLGFGVVALLSARILNWKKDRLELKTELMRNAYLVSAFLVFPYALAHLVPGKLVAVAWVGLASGYYVLNFVVQNQKYRWMGHGTLLLTTVYVVIVGTSRFEPVYRVLSFLVLGTVLLAVSLVFTRIRKRAGDARRTESAKGAPLTERHEAG